MQNNNKPNGFRRFLRDNGYYIVIGACLLAIGGSSFYLVRNNSLSDTAETMSVPVRIEAGTSEETPAEPQDTQDAQEQAASTEDETIDASAELPVESVEQAAEIQAQESVVAARTVVMPVAGEVLNEYSAEALSYNETLRDWRTHDGIDLAAETGTTVSAAEAGTVSAIYADDYLGTTVEITHDSGYVTTYANLAETPTVSVGQTVAAGDAIGTVGSTALLEVSQVGHLHFSVSKDGESVNPSDYLPE